jgi:pyruvate/2-oxoglutarate dehydrogenase complex dihydrolipoamide acyltransferase (E2) component
MRQDAFQEMVDVTVPELGTAGGAVEFVTWLVLPESEVIPGERIAELLTHGILFHLEAPAAGVLTDLRVSTGMTVEEAETIARIRSHPDE